MRGTALPVNAALVLVAGGLLGQIYNNVQLTQVPNNDFLTSLAIGLTAVQSSLPCFAAERPVYWREANRGLSKSAYFLGKSLSQIPYMLLAPVIYLSLFYTFTAPRAGFGETYIILTTAQFTVTGLGTLVSIVVAPASANVAAVILVTWPTFQNPYIILTTAHRHGVGYAGVYRGGSDAGASARPSRELPRGRSTLPLSETALRLRSV